ncbi:undecaprenyldiphospho-muramoylpentapeptide beta-N-acetylglucosaminyltransferase [Brevibacillus sp. SYP-B805]|uniref:undecaprenyldiphospho-muramoylpentapeptide beta-N-acetylglucosaminyltransferase n=1 Tax=Brevibacillus sp. SYP-B805 TaxID=1578199 RepID=UPI0013EA27CB|nr:undecaprenyldiphospho-muramoylpentapeptide beta-N-acetylglucosaminyltransferase [Brevibacillus sp. SYP-B805]NGQ93718.1 undecaprenyldiphospho-muramoylpentapeptide beta-N-acetylglucosaminyltransferase [Brevibacillus sp. SYP-B805]
MRIVLAGGGTGGHIYPALAVAKEMRRQEPQATFLYIGTTKGLEARLVPREGIPFEAVEIAGLKRKLTVENLRTAWKFVRAVRRSAELLREFRPDVVIGTGGYVCGPVVYAASRLGIPTVIHEQNVVPGLTNKFLARVVDRIAVSFEESLAHFPRKKTVFTGNPCATEVMHGRAEAGRQALGIPDGRRIVLIVGGSRGAKAINEAALQLLPMMGDEPDTHFVYVTGEVHFEEISSRLQSEASLPPNVTLLPYVHNMPDLLAATHVIVNRAGASTLAELTALGVPAVLIPSPYVTNNHQEKNARGLEKAGAAIVILERELTGESLRRALAPLLRDTARWSAMRERSLTLGKPDAAASICRLLREAGKT